MALSSLPPRLRPLARLLAKGLGLCIWDLQYEVHTQLEDPSLAGVVYRDFSYYRALIRILQGQPAKQEAETLTHELLHVGLYEVVAAACSLINQLPEAERERARLEWDMAEEQTVERLSRSLSPVFLKALKNG